MRRLINWYKALSYDSKEWLNIVVICILITLLVPIITAAQYIRIEVDTYRNIFQEYWLKELFDHYTS